MTQTCLTQEHKDAISKAHKGKIVSAETKAKMSKAKLGVPKSPEHRAAMAAAHRGKRLTEERKLELREQRAARKAAKENQS